MPVTSANDRDEMLTVKEVASRLRVHPMTVRKMIRSGRLPALQLGGRGTPVRVDPDELEAWLYGQPPEAAA